MKTTYGSLVCGDAAFGSGGPATGLGKPIGKQTVTLKLSGILACGAGLVAGMLMPCHAASPMDGTLRFNTPFAKFDGMVKREPWKPNPGVPPQPVDWQKILTLKEPCFVVGKQTISHIAPASNGPVRDIHTLGVMPIKSDTYNITSGPAHPGLEIVEFFPLAAGKGTGGEMNIMPAILTFQDAEGKDIAAVNDLDKRAWRPDLQTEYFRVGNATLVQEIANHDNIFVLRIREVDGKMPPRFSLRGDFGPTAGAFDVEQLASSTFVWGQETAWSNTCFALWSSQPLELNKISRPGETLSYLLDAKGGDEIILAFGFGYQMAELQKSMKAAVAEPVKIFADATQYWNQFFTRMVPRFSCSDPAYVRQYYYTFFNLMAAVWDIPYEPVAYPYTCSSKLVWKASWPWNSLFDTMSLRWLNDKSLAEGNVLQPIRLGRSMIHDQGSFPDLLPVKEVGRLPQFWNLSVLDAVWAAYLVSGNKDWLRKVYPACRQHYEVTCTGHDGIKEWGFPDRNQPLNAQGLAPWGLDEWDASARWGSYVYDTWVDSSTFLLSSAESLRGMAQEVGDTEHAKAMEDRVRELKKKISDLLWDDKSKLFLDANLAAGTFSPFHSAASFTPLYGGAATPEQAAELVKQLTDPKKFWTPYPIPGLAIDMPDFRPDGVNIGNGPIPPISCGWFQINGLVDYGYTGIAAELISRQVRMNTLEGASSAIKFNPITGEGITFFQSRKQNHTLCTMNIPLVDLIIRHVAGFRPRTDGLIEFRPVAVGADWDQMKWGPFQYGKRLVSVDWSKTGGMTVTCDGAKYHAPSLRHVVLKPEDGKLVPVDFAPLKEIQVPFLDMASSGRPAPRPSQRPPGARAYHWSFDGTADELLDGKFRGNAPGVAYGEGRFGQAAIFDGAAARVDMGKTDIQPGNQFTIAFWFKAGKTTGTNQVILAKGPKDNGHFEVFLNPNGEISFYAPEISHHKTGYSVAGGVWSSGYLVEDDKWHHVAVVRDNSDLRFYVDGENSSLEAAGGGFTLETENFAIGSLVDGTLPYTGSLDELHILGWSLNEHEVKELIDNKYPYAAQ